jgi:hypothetical protein
MMLWLRKHLVAVLFSAIIAFQAASVSLQFMIWTETHKTRWVRIYNAEEIGEEVAQHLTRDVLKVAICETNGRECAETYPVSLPGPRPSLVPGLPLPQLPRGLLVTNPERRN